MQRTRYILGLVLIFFAGYAFAQPNPGDPDVPITGVEYLLGAGAIYGLKRIIGRRKK